MLTDLALKRLKPQEKTYKVADRDGMYAAVSPAGQIVFRIAYLAADKRIRDGVAAFVGLALD